MNSNIENEKYCYELTIPLYLNGNSGIQESTENNKEYPIGEYILSLIMKDNDSNLETKNSNKNYYFKIKYFLTKEDAKTFFNKFQLAMQSENLNPTLWGIKEVSLNNVKFEQKFRESYLDKLKEETGGNILLANGSTFNVHMGFETALIQFKNQDEMIENMIQVYENLPSEFVQEDNTIKEAMHLYSLSYFMEESTKFVLWIIILELLNPREKITKNSLEYRKILLNSVKKFKNDPKNNKEVNGELNNFENALGQLKYKSISSTLTNFARENSIEYEDSENKSIEEYIKESYKVRNKLVHEGKKLENFGKCYSFLNNFILKLIKARLDEQLITCE